MAGKQKVAFCYLKSINKQAKYLKSCFLLFPFIYKKKGKEKDTSHLPHQRFCYECSIKKR